MYLKGSVYRESRRSSKESLRKNIRSSLHKYSKMMFALEENQPKWSIRKFLN